MPKEEKSLIKIENKSIFEKIKMFLRKIFTKKENNINITDNNIEKTEEYVEKDKKTQNSIRQEFIQGISNKENPEEIALIEKARKDKSIITKMGLEELTNLNEAIKKRQTFLNKKIEQLKNDIAIKNYELKNQNQ